ncbi:MAG: hypothetical protein KTR31_38560 [Myxococcales bacterium]|nr:hypothetical protein [Myxococcales bacterium]
MLLHAGCEPRFQSFVTDERGDLCFRQDGNDVVIDVAPPVCVGSGCIRNTDGECEVEVDGERLRIATWMSWDRDRWAKTCADNCASWLRCRVPNLAPGTYTYATFGPYGELRVPIQSMWCEGWGPDTTTSPPPPP